jgi:hypothetical protein
MDVAEFTDLLDRLGEELTAWPAAERDRADILLRNSEQARAALAEARLLREALRSAPVKAPAGLLDRIISKSRQSDGGLEDAPAPRDDKPDDDAKR